MDKLISWKICLYPHGRVGHIDKMRELATTLEYEFFCWNELIYRTSTGTRTTISYKEVQ